MYLEYDRLLALEGDGSGCGHDEMGGLHRVGLISGHQVEGCGVVGVPSTSNLSSERTEGRGSNVSVDCGADNGCSAVVDGDQGNGSDQCCDAKQCNDAGQRGISEQYNSDWHGISEQYNSEQHNLDQPNPDQHHLDRSNPEQQQSTPSTHLNLDSLSSTDIPQLQSTTINSTTIQDSLLLPPQDPNGQTKNNLSLSDMVPSAISIQDLSVSIQDASINGSPVNRRLSSSSMASLDEGPIPPFPTYTEKELTNLLRRLHIIVESHLKDHPYEMLPPRYQSIIEKLFCEGTATHYLDSLSLSILSTLLKCMAVRLFQFIQHAYYDRFVGTDLFEYLVSEQCFPSSSFFSPRLVRASMYAADRLKDCEEEIPYLRKFIQEYSQNALELMEPSVVPPPNLTCRRRRINQKKLLKQLSKVQRKRGRIELERIRGPFVQWTWRTLSAT